MSAAILCPVVLGNGAPATFGQLPNARLSTIHPPGGQAGTTVDVTLTGADLDEANRLHFSHPGIQATPKTTDPGPFDPPGPKPVANAFQVAVGKDVPPGVYEARAVGRFGISTPRAFVVGHRPEIAETEPNNAPDKPHDVPVNTVVNAHADAESYDHFGLVVKKSQRLIIECLARRIDSRMDAALILFDPHGREVRRSRGRNNKDPLLDFTAGADGRYVLAVHDFLYRGGREYFYRLTVTDGPHLDYAFPSAGVPGTKGTFTLYGRNLPGASPAAQPGADGRPLETLDVEIAVPADDHALPIATSALLSPHDAGWRGFDYRLDSPKGRSNPVRISFADAPVVTENPSDDKPENAQKVTPPCEFVGRFFPNGDRDWVSFEAKKGDVYRLEVFSQRLGHLTDVSFVIQRVTTDDKGRQQVAEIAHVDDTAPNLGGRDYNTATHDPSYRFQADQDAAYRVGIRDLYADPRPTPDSVYRLIIRRDSPNFVLIAAARNPPPAKPEDRTVATWTPLLRRGGVMPLRVIALRKDGFSGDIRLSVEGLPEKVSCPGATLGMGLTSTRLMLLAAEDAPEWAGPIRVVGTARIGDTEVVRSACGAAVTWPVGDYNTEPVLSRLTRDIAVKVTAAQVDPLFIQAGENKVYETSLAGKIEIPIKVVRRAEPKTDLELRVVGIPGYKTPPKLTIPAAAAEGKLTLELTDQDGNKFKTGICSFRLETQATVKYRNNPEAAATAAEEVKRLDKIVADATAAAKAAADADANLKTAQQAKAAAEKIAKALAEKAKPRDVKITRYSTNVTLKITPAPITLAIDSPPGPLNPGAKVELPVRITRLYGFADPVELIPTLPKERADLKIAPGSIARDQTETKLVIDVTPEAKVGDVPITVRSRLKLNGQDIEVARTATLKIEPVLRPIAVADIKQAEPVSFQNQILPIFQKKCLACHSETEAKGDLVLETPEYILEGGKSGPAVVAGKSSESLLLKLAAHRDQPIMPPKKNRVKAENLTPDELGLLKLWIDQGATGQVVGPTASLPWRPLPERVGPMYAIALTDDGLFAAAGRGNQVYLFHAPSGRQVGRLIDPESLKAEAYAGVGAAHRDIVQSVVFSADGNRLATGGYQSVKLWRRTRNAPRTRASIQSDAVFALALRPDGAMAAAGDDKGKIVLFNPADGKVIRTLAGHTARITALEFLPDSSRLLSGCLDKTVRLWNPNDGAQTAALQTPAPIHAIALAKKATQIATAHADGVIRLWAAPTDAQSQPAAPLGEFNGHTKPVTGLAALPAADHQLVSGSEDGTVRHWNMDDGKQLRQMDHGGAVIAVAVRPDGARIASAGANNAVRIWNPADGAVVAEIRGDFRARQTVFLRDRVVKIEDKRVKDIQGRVAGLAKRIETESQTVQNAARTRTEAEAALAAKTEAAKQAAAAKVAALATAKQAAERKAKADQAKAESEKALAAAAEVLNKAQQNAKALADALTAAQAGVKQAADALAKARTSAKTSPQDKALTEARAQAEKAVAAAQAKVKDAARKKADADNTLADAVAKHKAAVGAKAVGAKAATEAAQRAKQTADAATNAAKASDKAAAEHKTAQRARDNAADEVARAVSAAGQTGQEILATRTELGVAEVVLKRAQAALEESKKAQAASEKPIRSLAFSADGHHLAFAGDDARIHVYCAQTAKPVDVLEGHTAAVSALTFAPDGTLLSVAGKDLIRWNSVPAWTFERRIGAETDGPDFAHRVGALAFSPDATLLATGSGDPSRSGELKLWNTDTGKLARQIPAVHADVIYALAFSPDGKLLAAGSADRFVKVFEVATGKLHRSFEGHTHHVLDVAWRADGEVLASAGADNVMKIWQIRSAKQIKTVGGFEKEVTALRYVGLGDDLLACSGDATLRINDRRFPPPTDFQYACDVSLDGATVIAGGQAGVLRIYDTKKPELVHAIEPKPPKAPR